MIYCVYQLKEWINMISVGIFLEDNEDRRKMLWILEDYEKVEDKCFLHWKKEETSVLARLPSVWMNRISDYDIIVVSVEDVKDIEVLKKIRTVDGMVEIVVILKGDLLPEQLIVPDIRPILCLKSPLIIKNMQIQLLSLFQYIIRKKEEKGIMRRFSCQKDSVKRFIPFSEICYFETSNKQIIVKTKKGAYCFYDSLSRIESELPPYFIRCHRGYIVNIFCITEIHGVDEIYIGEEKTIPIAKKYQKKIKILLS